MPSIAAVVTRECAVPRARIAPPRSICDISQPPKMSPLAFASDGIAIVRITTTTSGAAGTSEAVAVMRRTGNVEAARAASRQRGTFLRGDLVGPELAHGLI